MFNSKVKWNRKVCNRNPVYQEFNKVKMYWFVFSVDTMLQIKIYILIHIYSIFVSRIPHYYLVFFILMISLRKISWNRTGKRMKMWFKIGLCPIVYEERKNFYYRPILPTILRIWKTWLLPKSKKFDYHMLLYFLKKIYCCPPFKKKVVCER